MKINKKAIVLAMASKGYNPSDLIKASGIPSGTFSRLFYTDGGIRPKTAYKLATALDVTVEEIVTLEGVE